MKPGMAKLYLAAVAAALVLAAVDNHAQQIPAAHAKDFTSHTYFEPPHEQQVKMKLSGAEALPLPGGLQDVRDLKIETFDVTGKAGVIVRAPQCNYALITGVANSAGHLEMQSGDGKFLVEGEGFLWQQDESLLIISNHVHTVIKGGTLKFSAP